MGNTDLYFNPPQQLRCTQSPTCLEDTLMIHPSIVQYSTNCTTPCPIYSTDLCKFLKVQTHQSITIVSPPYKNKTEQVVQKLFTSPRTTYSIIHNTNPEYTILYFYSKAYYRLQLHVYKLNSVRIIEIGISLSESQYGSCSSTCGAPLYQSRLQLILSIYNM